MFPLSSRRNSARVTGDLRPSANDACIVYQRQTDERANALARNPFRVDQPILVSAESPNDQRDAGGGNLRNSGLADGHLPKLSVQALIASATTRRARTRVELQCPAVLVVRGLKPEASERHRP